MTTILSSKLTQSLFLKRDNAFWVAYVLLTIVIGYLNRQSNLMGGLLPYYMDYAEVIRGGFDPSLASIGRPTFPMWGYGWIFLLTTNKLTICLIQVFLAALAIHTTLDYLKNKDFFGSNAIGVLKVLILMSFSWIAIQFGLSPYSFAISFQIISLVYIFKGLESNCWRRTLLYISISALCFGLLLNFRSDYFYFTAMIVPISFWCCGWRKGLVASSIWILIVHALLLPWALYTQKVVGEPLLTSTNSGHVFYIGLGSLPGNKWGIIPEDSDPKMAEELIGALGEKGDSLTYEGDKWLKKRFVELVVADPLEYTKKVAYSAGKTLVSGIYVPEFHNLRPNCLGDCKSEFTSDVINSPISALFESREKFFIYGLSYLSIFIGIALLLISYLVLPFVLIDSVRKKNIFLVTCCLLLLYQLAINSFAFQMKLYSTNTYFYGLVLVAFFGKRFFPEK